VTARVQNLAVIGTCFVAAMTYAGAVTMDGMAAFVLPGVAGAALVGWFFAARRMPGTALVVGAPLVLAWSELVNVWSGNGAGPAARSACVAAACTLVAVVVAWSSSPALFLIPVAASVCGALLLGAGAEVRIVAVAAVVSATLTLGGIEQSRRNWTARARRGAAVLLLPLLVGVVAAGVVLLQAHRDSRPPEALAAGLAHPGIKPPWKDPLGTAAHRLGSPPPRQTAPQSRPRPRPRQHPQPPRPQRSRPQANKRPPKPVHPRHRPSSAIWLYVLAGILSLVLLVAARLLAVRLAWRRLKRRLTSGSPAEQITGAWAWMRIRLAAARLPLAPAVSPDLVATGGEGSGLPPEVFMPLQAVATAATTAAFAAEQPLGPADVIAAWTAADSADASARGLLTKRARVGRALRGPAARMGSG
jgi:hypothetical protein